MVDFGGHTIVETMNATTAPRFFRFREERYWPGSQPIVGFAPIELVSALVSTDEIDEMFGGHLQYESLGDGQRHLGVWGDRKASRFLRLLRERGAELEIESSGPAEFRLRHRSTR